MINDVIITRNDMIIIVHLLLSWLNLSEITDTDTHVVEIIADND